MKLIIINDENIQCKIDLKDLLEQIRNSFNLENSSIDTYIFSKDEEIRSLVNKSYLSETLSEEDKKITSKRIIEKIKQKLIIL